MSLLLLKAMESSNDNDDVVQEIAARAEKAVADLLPSKSRANYEKEYKIFTEWMVKYSAKTVNETVLLAYFQELVCIYLVRLFQFLKLFFFAV